LLLLRGSTNPQDFLDIAHKIKGAARIVQACRLIDSCEALETTCRDELHGEKVAECCAAVERAMLELDQALLQEIGKNGESRMTEA
jgi:two-component system sensor histidine kinase EvgS